MTTTTARKLLVARGFTTTGRVGEPGVLPPKDADVGYQLEIYGSLRVEAASSAAEARAHAGGDDASEQAALARLMEKLQVRAVELEG